MIYAYQLKPCLNCDIHLMHHTPVKRPLPLGRIGVK